MVALRTGRLANRIVLFANVIAFAEEHGYEVLNPAFQTYAALFESTRDTLLCPYPPPRRGAHPAAVIRSTAPCALRGCFTIWPSSSRAP